MLPIPTIVAVPDGEDSWQDRARTEAARTMLAAYDQRIRDLKAIAERWDRLVRDLRDEAFENGVLGTVDVGRASFPIVGIRLADGATRFAVAVTLGDVRRFPDPVRYSIVGTDGVVVVQGQVAVDAAGIAGPDDEAIEWTVDRRA